MDFSRNEKGKRFELALDGDIAFVDYRLDGNQIELTHAEVPEALEGHGLGSELVRLTVAYARDNDLMVIPGCSFVRWYFEQHPEERDVLVA